MVTNLLFIEQIEQARRREAERKAAEWRRMRRTPAFALPLANRGKQALLGLWQRIGWLARIKDRKLLRARLREYAAR